jgi:hypothetical protein
MLNGLKISLWEIIELQILYIPLFFSFILNIGLEFTLLNIYFNLK